ncbi:MAG TPA: hypothetical protein VKG65_11545 [Terriglobales bacterium]|nr:hypothetical protein [Terriglobales bacterium]
MLTSLVLTFTLLLQAASSSATVKAWIENHEVWIEKDGEAHVVLYDGMAVEPVEVSPSGDKVIYAELNPKFDQEHCANTPRQYVVLANASGHVEWKAGPEDACGEFDRFDWIDEHRIGVMHCGHANCFYWILDASSGKVLKQLGGGFDFLWSHNRESVAHRGVGMTPDDGDSLMFDDNLPIYPPTDPTSHFFPIRRIGELTWSPDDKWLSFGETEYPSYDSYVVLVNPSGRFLRESMPVDVDAAAKVEWIDNTHLQISTSGRTFKFVVTSDTLTEIVQH